MRHSDCIGDFDEAARNTHERGRTAGSFNYVVGSFRSDVRRLGMVSKQWCKPPKAYGVIVANRTAMVVNGLTASA
jgi:hypothetical protein